MPHTQSAKKRLRQGEKRRQINRAAKRAIKTQIKKLTDLAESGRQEELQKEYNIAAKKLDKAAAKRIVHPNLAARKKSQLARLLKQKPAATAAP